jgi:hypothetical protein
MRIYAYYNGYFNPVSILSGIASQNKERQRRIFYMHTETEIIGFFGMRKHSTFLK